MTQAKKILTTVTWVLMVLAMLSVIGAGVWAKRANDAEDAARTKAAAFVVTVPASETGVLPEHYNVPEFSLLNEHGQTVTNVDLKGDVWVAAFIFTKCAASCPMMSAKMRGLQKQVDNPRVKFVSFTVDPLRDTPDVLQKYAKQLGADTDRWYFLTGTLQQMADMAKGMKISSVPTDDPDNINHSDRFLLVDGAGRVRGVYHSNDEEAMDRLRADITKLADSAGPDEGSATDSERDAAR